MRDAATRVLLACVAGASVWCGHGVLATPSPADPAVRLGALAAPWTAVGAAAAFAVVLFGRGPLSRAMPVVALAVLALPWLPCRIPAAFLLWTGALGAGVVLAAVFAVVLARPVKWPSAIARVATNPRAAPLLGASVALAVFVGGAASMRGILPGGDEPHYLVITQSLLLDGDLRIENNHRRGDHTDYFPGPLRPHYLRRGLNGEIYSVHAPGLPVLILPAFALAGHSGAVLFLSLVAAAGTALAWRLAWHLTHDAGAAWFAWASGTLAAPFTIQAYSVFPDATASVLALTGVAALLDPPGPGSWRLVAHGACLAVLPWLHTRHAVIAATLGAFIGVRLLLAERSIRPLARFLAVPAFSAIGWFGYFQALYGTPSPGAPYGSVGQTSSWSNLATSIPGLLFDGQFGLLTHAPVLIVSIAGFWALARATRPLPGATPGEQRFLAVALVVTAVAYAGVSGTHQMWWAGSSSPARFLVPLVLPSTLPAAVAWTAARRGGASRVAAGLLLWLTASITAVLLVVDGGRLAFNARDGFSRLADWLSPVANLAGALPALITEAPGVALVKILAWCAAAAGTWGALLACERWLRAASGTLAAVALAAGAAGAMGATTIAWAAAGAMPVREGASTVALLRAVADAQHPVLVALGHGAAERTTRSALLGRLQLRTVSRARRGPGDLVVLPDVPAGRYRAHVTGAVPGARVAVVVGRGDGLAVGGIDGSGAAVLDVALPVGVPALVVRSAANGGQGGRAASAAGVHERDAWIEPLRVGAPGRLRGVRALAAASYGDTTLFALDDEAFVEPGGVWTGASSTAAFVLQAPAGRSVRVRVSGGPLDNVCDVVTGTGRERLQLGPGEWRELVLPAGHEGRPVEMRVTASGGFRPSDVDGRKLDRRRLGCRLEFP